MIQSPFKKPYTVWKWAYKQDNVKADYSVANLLLTKKQHDWSQDAQGCQNILTERWQQVGFYPLDT